MTMETKCEYVKKAEHNKWRTNRRRKMIENEADGGVNYRSNCILIAIIR